MGPDGRPWVVVELTDSDALHAEGAAMRHCVVTYAGKAARGECAIFSLRTDTGYGYVPRLTVQLELPARRVVQARGPCNIQPAAAEWSVLTQWAQAQGLTVVSC
jgi:hypothetical protein